MNRVEITLVEQDGIDGVLVTFSDGTIAGYVVEELLDMRRYREHVRVMDADSYLKATQYLTSFVGPLKN